MGDWVGQGCGRQEQGRWGSKRGGGEAVYIHKLLKFYHLIVDDSDVIFTSCCSSCLA